MSCVSKDKLVTEQELTRRQLPFSQNSERGAAQNIHSLRLRDVSLVQLVTRWSTHLAHGHQIRVGL